jgi:hypothetical protein
VRDILDHVGARVAALGDHPLFTWLASDDLPPKERLMILPSVATVAMGFRDVNRWVLRYPQAADDLERGINVHTFEDQTHSRLFLADWRRLGLDRRLGWAASDTLWWLFRAGANEAVRDQCLYFLTIAAADRGDPVLRFAHAEVGEACARDLFFAHISAVAAEVAEHSGLEMLYFGAHHIEAEGEGAEGEFASLVLDDARRARARELVDAMVEVFARLLDAIHEYAVEYVSAGVAPRPRGERAELPAPRPVAPVEVPVHPAQQAAVALLRERRARSAAHPLFTWLHHRGRVSARQALQRLLPLWASDVLGFADLGRRLLRYPEPATGLESAVNTWIDDLTARNARLVDDWAELDLDELLGWDAGDTLTFYYLSRTTDLPRRQRAVLAGLAAEHTDPVQRLWLLIAISQSVEVLLDGTCAVAEEAEATNGLRLDFLAGRVPVRTPAFTDQPLTAGQREAVGSVVETVFTYLDQFLDLSLEVALSNDFDIP